MLGKVTQAVPYGWPAGALAGRDQTQDHEGVDPLHRIEFLGGVLLESQVEEIECNSRSGVQDAADALQHALLHWLTQFSDLDVRMVNVPFIGLFPKTHRKAWFPAVKDVLFGKVPVSGMGFFNLLVARDHARKRAAYRGLMPVVRGAQDCVILTYSAHPPIIRAAIACRQINPAVRTCVIVPDLIEQMGDYGPLLRLLAQYRGRSFKALAQMVDFFVVLTPHMANQMGIGPDRHVVIEGVFDPEPPTPALPWSTEPGPFFTYTCTLAKRYGILDLLDAFSKINVPTARLWICDIGDAQDSVEDLARRNRRVTYHGRVPRAEAVVKQARAHVMVNPRRPEDEFTRYSFPSKKMEHLASGRPVIMHWLPGIPEEHRPHLITPQAGDAQGLTDAMRRVATMVQDEPHRIGAAGCAFFLTHKIPRRQIGNLLAGLFPGRRREGFN